MPWNKKKEKVDKVRLTFDFTEVARDRLEKMRVLLDAGSLAEVVRRALGVMDYILENRKRGGTLILREPDGTEREVLIS